jgi:hypothetical protein
MIPKTIHYCWFGGAPLTKLAQKCVASWKEYCPGYTFMLWNEANFDINTVQFTAQVAKIKKWGFIVDYIRAWAVFNFGGIYLDTDVELYKPLDDLLDANVCFAGFEDMEYINPGSIFAGEKDCTIALEVMDYYSHYDIFDGGNRENLVPSPRIFTNILLKYGLAMNNSYQKLGVFTAYPSDYFSPKLFVTDTLNITENTYSIHHYEGSWLSAPMKRLLKEKIYLNKKIKNIMIKTLLIKLCVLKKIILEKLNIE